MYRHLCVALLIGLGMAAQTTSADARWNKRGVCKPVLEGVATGDGLFGLFNPSVGDHTSPALFTLLFAWINTGVP